MKVKNIDNNEAPSISMNPEQDINVTNINLIRQ